MLSLTCIINLCMFLESWILLKPKISLLMFHLWNQKFKMHLEFLGCITGFERHSTRLPLTVRILISLQYLGGRKSVVRYINLLFTVGRRRNWHTFFDCKQYKLFIYNKAVSSAGWVWYNSICSCDLCVRQKSANGLANRQTSLFLPLFFHAISIPHLSLESSSQSGSLGR